jgi:hypothetical protein
MVHDHEAPKHANRRLYEIKVLVELDEAELEPLTDGPSRVVCPHDVQQEPERRCPRRWFSSSTLLDAGRPPAGETCSTGEPS